MSKQSVICEQTVVDEFGRNLKLRHPFVNMLKSKHKHEKNMLQHEVCLASSISQLVKQNPDFLCSTQFSNYTVTNVSQKIIDLH